MSKRRNQPTVQQFEAAPPSHTLKAADVTAGSPELGKQSVDNLAAVPLTSGVPEFTAPTARQTEVRKAQQNEVWAEIDAALKEVEAAKKKPPSPKELRKPVMLRLLNHGLKATKTTVENIARDFTKQYPHRFQPQGKRWR